VYLKMYRYGAAMKYRKNTARVKKTGESIFLMIATKASSSWGLNRFNAFYSANKIKEALQFARRAFMLSRNSEKLWIAYLDVLYHHNEPLSLEESLKAYKLFPNSFDFTNRLGRAHLYAGDAEKAVHFFKKNVDPTLGWLLHLAQAEYFLGNTQEAILCCLQLLVQVLVIKY